MVAKMRKQRLGDAGEAAVRRFYAMHSYRLSEYKPNQPEYDFIATKTRLDGSEEMMYVEVKAGPHGLTEIQREKQKKVARQGGIYRVERLKVPPIFFEDIPEHFIDTIKGRHVHR
jgi:Holliday junction resolvase-like predicted endonuclease